MFNLRGFITQTSLANNDRRVVAPLGELSVYAETFSRDRQIFKASDYPAVKLVAFSSYQEVSATERVEIKVPTAVQTICREIGAKMHVLAEAGDFTNSTQLVEETLLGLFGDRIKAVVVYPMVSDGNRWLPGSIQFEGTSSASPYTVRLWFSDASFRNEYDEFQIDVVPIMDDIDRLFGSPEEIEGYVKEYMNPMAISEKIRILRDGDPETEQIVNEYEWRQPGRPDIRRNISIGVLVYGEAGMSPDHRRKAIADWILANSQYGEDAWREVLPDIFSPTEFIIIPSWNRYALPSGTIQDWSNGGWPVGVLSSGTYMPGGNVDQQIPFALKFAKGVGYTQEYVSKKLNLVTFVYKSICLNILGGYRNRDGVDQFLDRWPDYMAVGTGSTDFFRMSEATQKMVNLFVDLLRIAETMTNSSTIPRQYARTTRDGILMLSAEFERTQILVVSRKSVAELYKYTTGSANVLN